MASRNFQKEVFTHAVAKAKEIRTANPKLTVAEATKKAWATPEIKKRMEDYRKKSASAKPAAKKPAKKPAAKKAAKK